MSKDASPILQNNYGQSEEPTSVLGNLSKLKLAHILAIYRIAHLAGESFLIQGYPLATKLSDILAKPVRVDNDTRLICLAKAIAGSGRGLSPALVITLRTGIDVGICKDSKPLESEPFFRLAGHLKVRGGRDSPGSIQLPAIAASAAAPSRHALGLPLRAT